MSLSVHAGLSAHRRAHLELASHPEAPVTAYASIWQVCEGRKAGGAGTAAVPPPQEAAAAVTHRALARRAPRSSVRGPSAGSSAACPPTRTYFAPGENAQSRPASSGQRERKQLQLILLAAAAQGQTGGRGTTRRRETSLHTYTRDTGGAGHKNNEHARRSARVCRSQCTRG